MEIIDAPTIQTIDKSMKQHPLQLDQEAERMAKALAAKWGLPKQRYTSRVILRCLERVYAQEFDEANNALAPDAKGRAGEARCSPRANSLARRTTRLHQTSQKAARR